MHQTIGQLNSEADHKKRYILWTIPVVEIGLNRVLLYVYEKCLFYIQIIFKHTPHNKGGEVFESLTRLNLWPSNTAKAFHKSQSIAHIKLLNKLILYEEFVKARVYTSKKHNCV